MVDEIRTPFTLDDGVTTIELVVDRLTSRKRNAAFTALRVSRDIGTGETVITSPMVNTLVTNYEVPAQLAVDKVRESMPEFLETANRDALFVALFDPLFKIEFDGGIPTVIFTLGDYTVSQEDFDDTETNDLRWLTALQAPLPIRRSDNVIEQKLMYLQKMLESNPRFALSFTRTFENWFAAKAQIEMEARKTDPNGFQPRNVGTDENAGANPNSQA